MSKGLAYFLWNPSIEEAKLQAISDIIFNLIELQRKRRAYVLNCILLNK